MSRSSEGILIWRFCSTEAEILKLSRASANYITASANFVRGISAGKLVSFRLDFVSVSDERGSVINDYLQSNYSGKQLNAEIEKQIAIGNLRTTTKFTTTTSVDWEKTGTRTSVSTGKWKLKMQSVGRSTTMTTLDVNTNVKLRCSFATKFFAMASFKIMQDLIFLS